MVRSNEGLPPDLNPILALDRLFLAADVDMADQKA